MRFSFIKFEFAKESRTIRITKSRDAAVAPTDKQIGSCRWIWITRSNIFLVTSEKVLERVVEALDFLTILARSGLTSATSLEVLCAGLDIFPGDVA